VLRYIRTIGTVKLLSSFISPIRRTASSFDSLKPTQPEVKVGENARERTNRDGKETVLLYFFSVPTVRIRIIFALVPVLCKHRKYGFG